MYCELNSKVFKHKKIKNKFKREKISKKYTHTVIFRTLFTPSQN